ncbi:AP complex subunit beta [Penicillium atrosanguineum]|nr:AP complex subunit beta [Penicillium atrosanguineum]
MSSGGDAKLFARLPFLTPCLLRPDILYTCFLMFIAFGPYASPSSLRFARTSQGKVAELRQELNSGGKKDKNYSAKKIALKKIVANMTMSNNDMVALFPDVIDCMNLPSLEIKKMCFLFLVNYSRMKPEVAMKALSILVDDMADDNPLVRALALRTISYVHVREFVEATFQPLKRLMQDSDPYVRKTAAFCVAKLYEHDKKTVENSDLIDRLNKMLKDENPTVVSSVLASLVDIWGRSESISLTIDYVSASKLVSILPDCSEWGQSYILEALMSYVPQDNAEALLLAERIAPRDPLSHELHRRGEAHHVTLPEIITALVTLLSKPPEVQYLALRNAILILQKRPEVLRNDIRVFFCNYNDPIYVKVTKLELMFMLTTKDNISVVLAELREYATEIDVHFVRKAVRAIGKLAIKIESAAKQCIDTLLELVDAKIPYIVQEATVVIRNIFRKYPNQYESIISHVISNIDDLDEPEAKAAIIWIIGQYADRIENSDGLLQDYLATFHDETIEVQLALLTATVKFFIQRPTKGQQLVPQVLKWCTEETDDPDLRDRGYMYWRLLSTDPATAKQVVMGQKPPITAESEKLDPRTLEELCLNVGTLATVYLKPIHQVFRAARPRRLQPSPALQRPRIEDGTGTMLEYNPPSASMPAASTSNSVGSVAPGTNTSAEALSAADSYFNNIGSQQMASMDIGGRDDGVGGGGALQTQYVVTQNQQQAYQPQFAGGAATGELLLL